MKLVGETVSPQTNQYPRPFCFCISIFVQNNFKCAHKCTEKLNRNSISSDEASCWNSVSWDKSIPSSSAYCAISHLYTPQFFASLISSQTKSFFGKKHLPAPPLIIRIIPEIAYLTWSYLSIHWVLSYCWLAALETNNQEPTNGLDIVHSIIHWRHFLVFLSFLFVGLPSWCNVVSRLTIA